MKRRAAILLAFSILFLVLGVIAIDDIQRKPLFTALGILFGVAGMIFTFIDCRHSKRHWLTAGGLIIGYGLYLGLGFRSATLGSFFPEGFTVESVDLISAVTNERVIWTPGAGEPQLSDENGYPALIGGSADEMAIQAENIVVRSYWWPGAVKSSKISEISVYLTNGEVSGRVSLYQSGGAEYEIMDSLQSGSRQLRHCLLFGDLTDILPEEVTALFP